MTKKGLYDETVVYCDYCCKVVTVRFVCLRFGLLLGSTVVRFFIVYDCCKIFIILRVL